VRFVKNWLSDSHAVVMDVTKMLFYYFASFWTDVGEICNSSSPGKPLSFTTGDVVTGLPYFRAKENFTLFPTVFVRLGKLSVLLMPDIIY